MKAAVILFTAMLAGPLSAATVVNGSFEQDPGVTGNLGGTFANLNTSGRSWDVWNSVPGWNTASGPGIEIQSNRTLGQIDAHSGDYYVELDSHGGRDTNSSMYQDIFLSAGSYELSFYFSPRRNNPGTNGIAYSVSGAGGSFLSSSVTGPGGGTAVGSWTEVTGLFSLASDETVRLQFWAIGNDDSLGGFVDDVSIAPVPLPAAGLLMLAGLGGLGLMRARRKA